MLWPTPGAFVARFVKYAETIAPAPGESAPRSAHEVCPCARRSGVPTRSDWCQSVPIAVHIDREGEAGFEYGPYFSEPAEATVATVRPALA